MLRLCSTGRAGATGKAFTLATSEDAEAVANIEKLTGQPITRVARSKAESPKPVEREERQRPARKERAERPRREERRAAPIEAPDEGWNGPIPAFLDVGLA